MRTMHVMARLTLGELARAGVRLDPAEDFHHLVEIDRLARIAAGLDETWAERRCFTAGRMVGRVALAPLSIGKRLFLRDEVMPHVDATDRATELAAMAFTMRSDVPVQELVQSYTGRPDAFLTDLRAWLGTLDVTWQQLDEAVRSLLPPPVPDLDAAMEKKTPAAAPADPNYGSICATLARHFGRDPAWWFWEADEAMADEMLRQLAKQREAEARRVTVEGKTVQAPDPGSRWIKARVALTKYKAMLIEQRANAANVV